MFPFNHETGAELIYRDPDTSVCSHVDGGPVLVKMVCSGNEGSQQIAISFWLQYLEVRSAGCSRALWLFSCKKMIHCLVTCLINVMYPAEKYTLVVLNGKRARVLV